MFSELTIEQISELYKDEKRRATCDITHNYRVNIVINKNNVLRDSNVLQQNGCYRAGTDDAGTV